MSDDGITRRSVLGHVLLATLVQRNAAWAQVDDDPLRQLRASHPRLILLDADLDRVRSLVRDNMMARRIYGDLEKECDRLATTPVSEYKLVGPRLRAVARRILDRVGTLAIMYRLTLREPYLRRAVAELKAGAAFRDWNPALFADTSDMAHAFALGYDWLFNALSTEERAWMRDAVVAKAFDAALPIYQRDAAWTRDRYNVNMTANAGLGLAALAFAGDKLNDSDQAETEKCGAVLRYVLESLPHGLSTYGVEGSWPEGMAYWETVTRDVSAFLSALQTALGNDYGLSSFHGVDRAGRYRVHMTGPTGKVFNFGDAPEDIGLSPEMFWMSKRFSVPAYAWSEQRAIERTGHPDAYNLAWFDPNAKPPQQNLPPFPTDAIFRGVDVACFRSAWDDPNAIYLAVKGGDNKDPHTHLDLGSFVLDAGGVRWAADLGTDDYDLPGYLGRQRYTYYRTRTESHNTLLIDDQNQDTRAEARITRQDFSPDFSWVQIDLSRANPGKVKQWTRRCALVQRQAVLMEDSVRCDQPVEVIWGMMTDADITLNGQTATLKKNG
jgi:hypothetical protein